MNHYGVTSFPFMHSLKINMFCTVPCKFFFLIKCNIVVPRNLLKFTHLFDFKLFSNIQIYFIQGSLRDCTYQILPYFFLFFQNFESFHMSLKLYLSYTTCTPVKYTVYPSSTFVCIYCMHNGAIFFVYLEIIRALNEYYVYCNHLRYCN